MLSDGAYEFHDGITVALAEIEKLDSGVVSIALLGISMPHYSLHLGAGAAVVKTVVGTSQLAGQAATP